MPQRRASRGRRPRARAFGAVQPGSTSTGNAMLVGLKDAPVWYRHAIGGAHALLCVLVIGILTACAELPLCPVAKILPIDTDRGTVFVLDAENLELMRRRMVGMHNRTCAPGPFFAVDIRADGDARAAPRDLPEIAGGRARSFVRPLNECFQECGIETMNGMPHSSRSTPSRPQASRGSKRTCTTPASRRCCGDQAAWDALDATTPGAISTTGAPGESCLRQSQRQRQRGERRRLALSRPRASASHVPRQLRALRQRLNLDLVEPAGSAARARTCRARRRMVLAIGERQPLQLRLAARRRAADAVHQRRHQRPQGPGRAIRAALKVLRAAS
jgi:hypothetical protein